MAVNTDDPAEVFISILGWFAILLVAFLLGAFFAWLAGVKLLLWIVFGVLGAVGSFVYFKFCFPPVFGAFFTSRRPQR